VFPLRSWDITRIRRRDIYLVLDTDRISQEERVFDRVYLEQEEGWRLDKAVIAIQTNPSFAQREHNSITLLDDRINATVLV